MDFGFVEAINTALVVTKVVYLYKILFNNEKLEDGLYIYLIKN